MMHGTAHNRGMNGIGSITALLIWTLLILAIIYLYQKIMEESVNEA